MASPVLRAPAGLCLHHPRRTFAAPSFPSLSLYSPLRAQESVLQGEEEGAKGKSEEADFSPPASKAAVGLTRGIVNRRFRVFTLHGTGLLIVLSKEVTCFSFERQRRCRRRVGSGREQRGVILWRRLAGAAVTKSALWLVPMEPGLCS